MRQPVLLRGCGVFEMVAQEGKEVVIMGDFNTNMLCSKARRFQLLTTVAESSKHSGLTT